MMRADRLKVSEPALVKWLGAGTGGRLLPGQHWAWRSPLPCCGWGCGGWGIIPDREVTSLAFHVMFSKHLLLQLDRLVRIEHRVPGPHHAVLEHIAGML
jgi:hypothetical protein